MIDKLDLSNKAFSIRRLLGEDNSSPIDIFTLAQTIDSLTLVFYPLGKNISGACLKNKLSSIIAINSDMSIGRQRYSLAHEFYHLYFDEKLFSAVCSSKIGNGIENEKKADQFASYFLIPPIALYETINKLKKGKKRKLTLEEIIRLEQYFGVSHQAMLNRLIDEKEITNTDASVMQKGIINIATKLGFDISLYQSSSETKKSIVLGHYIYQAEKLLQEELISDGKYEELLLDAFRDDIVYGAYTDGGEVID